MDNQRNSLAEHYDAWLDKRLEHWLHSVALLRARQGKQTLAEARKVLAAYKAISRDVALAKREVPNSQLLSAMEALHTELHAAIHKSRYTPFRDLITLYLHHVPNAIRNLRTDLSVVIVLFLSSMVGGYLMILRWPATATWWFAESDIANLRSGELWTDGLLSIVPSSVLSMELMTNNILVAMSAFAFGILYGLGTFYIVVLNGVLLGVAFALTGLYELDGALFRFVIAHGLVELSVICIAAAGGLALGRAVARPEVGGRATALRELSGDAGALAAIAVPFLIGSGLIEGYVSPSDAYSLPARIAIGVGWFMVLALVLDGRFWRRPHLSNKQVQVD